MKKIMILLLIPLFFACGAEQEQEIERLKRENDSLKKIVMQGDESIAEFMEAFNEIEANLQQIKEKENIIRLNTENADQGVTPDVKERINQDISSIYDLMQENKRAMDALQRKMRKANLQNKEFRQMVETLQRQLESKNNEIVQLHDELASLNIEVEEMSEEIRNLNSNVDSLREENTEKEEIIDEKTQALNTVYYAVGTKRELIDKGIITKTGGFIGIGRTEKLVEDINKDYFTKADLTKTEKIPIYNKKAEIVTTHPAGSYTFTGDNPIEELVISNPKKFWSVSKFLVVIVK